MRASHLRRRQPATPHRLLSTAVPPARTGVAAGGILPALPLRAAGRYAVAMIRTAVLVALVAGAPAAALTRAVPPASHDYLLGRLADADNRLDDAARFYDEALKADPGDGTLQRRAFDTALAAGDEKLAVDLARGLEAAGAGDATTAMVRLADAVKRRDWTAAAAVKGLPDTGYAAVVAPVTGAWIRVGRGDIDGALALVDPAKFGGIAQSYVTEHRAMILVAAKRYAEAAPLLVTMVGGEAKNVDRLRIAAAAALAAHAPERRGAGARSRPAAPTRRCRQRRSGWRPARRRRRRPSRGRASPGWRRGSPATWRARSRCRWRSPLPASPPSSRPTLGETWLVTGDVLLRGGRATAALAAYDHVGARDPLAATAAVHRGLALADLGRDAEARQVFEAATKRTGAAADDWQRLGDLERKLGNQAAAAAVDYGQAIALAGDKAGWQLYFLRGSALEQAGDWARGEADLRTALKLAPDEPTVLNYLGYALLDRGQKLPEAQALIATAAKLRPDDGFIADSLGWAWYRTGDVARAVPQLERAVRLEPGDATINDHLGDAYWRAGRRLEARFRWRAAGRPGARAGGGGAAGEEARLRSRPRADRRRGRRRRPARVIEAAPAKVNLALHVRRRRADGYHDLETLFAFTAFGDTLRVTRGGALALTVGGPFAGGGRRRRQPRPARGAGAGGRGGRDAARGPDLDKHIPVAAGPRRRLGRCGGGAAPAQPLLGPRLAAGPARRRRRGRSAPTSRRASSARPLSAPGAATRWRRSTSGSPARRCCWSIRASRCRPGRCSPGGTGSTAARSIRPRGGRRATI